MQLALLLSFIFSILLNFILIVVVVAYFGYSWQLLRAKFMKNPMFLNIVGLDGKVRTRKLINTTDKSYKIKDNDERIITLENGIIVDGVMNLFYYGTEVQPICLADVQRVMSCKEWDKLALLLRLEGANEFIPNLLKSITTILVIFLCVAGVLIIANIAMTGTGVITAQQCVAGVAEIKSTLATITSNSTIFA